jgi:excisionase family DNA binding protein
MNAAKVTDQTLGTPRERGSNPMQEPIDTATLLTPNEVAEIFRVNPKTVTRWAQSGKISAIRTLGGHRRFNAAEIMRHLEEQKSA